MSKVTTKNSQLKFSTVVTIVITIISMVFTYESESKTINWGSAILYIVLYFILAFAHGNYDKIEGKGIKVIVQNSMNLAKKIFKGCINYKQACWIFCYTAYNIIIASNYLKIPMPFSVIVIIGFIMGLALTKNNMKKISELVKDLVLPPKPKEKILSDFVEEQETSVSSNPKIIIKRKF